MSLGKRTMPPRGSDGRFKASEKNPAVSTKNKTIATAQPSRSPSPNLDDLLGPDTAEEDTHAAHSFAGLQSFPSSAFASPHISTAPLTPTSLSAPPDSPRAPSPQAPSPQAPSPQAPSPRTPSPPPRNRPTATRVMNFAQAGDAFGGWPNQDPEAFIRNVERQMIISNVATAAEKARYLMLCLEVKSPADKWFKGLDPAVKTDWARLEPEFTQKWATHQTPQRSDLEKTQDLLNHRLKPEEVSEQVPFWGTTEYTHIVWAEEMTALVQAHGLETRHEYVYQAMTNLPNAVKDNMEGEVTDWTTFIAAVKAIKIEKLKAQAKTEKDQAERDRATKTEIDQLRAQIEKLTLASATRQTGQSHQIAQPTFDRTTPSASTPGRNRQPRAPATEAEKAAIQQKLKAYPHQPDTDAGRVTYRRQMA